MLEAYFTRDAKSHYSHTYSESKAAAAEKFREIIKNAEYIGSSEHDVHSKAGENITVKMWDSFVGTVKIGDDIIPITFSVRSGDFDTRAQIYSVNMKAEPPSYHEGFPQEETEARRSNYAVSANSAEDSVTQTRENSQEQSSYDAMQLPTPETTEQTAGKPSPETENGQENTEQSAQEDNAEEMPREAEPGAGEAPRTTNSPALEKLGVYVAEPITETAGAERLVQMGQRQGTDQKPEARQDRRQGAEGEGGKAKSESKASREDVNWAVDNGIISKAARESYSFVQIL